MQLPPTLKPFRVTLLLVIGLAASACAVPGQQLVEPAPPPIESTSVDTPAQVAPTENPLQQQPVPGCLGKPTDPTGFLFLSNRDTDGPYRIWQADLDGSNQQLLAGPTELHIAWHDLDEAGNRLVVAGSTPGWKPNPLSPAHVVNGPQTTIALIDLARPNEAATVVIDADRGDHGFQWLWHPTFSPDGEEIVFAAAAPGELMNLWILNVGSGELNRLVNEPGRSHNDPSWTPDGRILFARRSELGGPNPFNLSAFDVWVMDPREPLVDPGNPPRSYQRVTNEAGLAAATAATDLEDGPKGDTDPSMSPDCRNIVNLRWESQEPLLIGRWSTVIHSATGDVDPSYGSDVDIGHTTSVAHWEDPTTILVERTTWNSGGLIPTADGAGIWRIDLTAEDIPELLVPNDDIVGHNTLPISWYGS